VQLIDLSFDDPAENLAMEEVLLDAAEAGLLPDTLRLWESPVPFVVLGTAQRYVEAVNDENCLADSVPVLRRCSAGGCVLQGPGSLNYSLFLTMETFPEVRQLHGSYRFILARLRDAFQNAGLDLRHAGISDLALGALKVSGNAQRRRRRAILHHGTLLYRPDYTAMARYLREPAQRPEWRGSRNHQEFVGAFPLPPGAIRDAVCRAFEIDTAPVPVPSDIVASVRRLAAEKYRMDIWTRRR
jgi:lipoate---protein ligase